MKGRSVLVNFRTEMVDGRRGGSFLKGFEGFGRIENGSELYAGVLDIATCYIYGYHPDLLHFYVV